MPSCWLYSVIWIQSAWINRKVCWWSAKKRWSALGKSVARTHFFVLFRCSAQTIPISTGKCQTLHKPLLVRALVNWILHYTIQSGTLSPSVQCGTRTKHGSRSSNLNSFHVVQSPSGGGRAYRSSSLGCFLNRLPFHEPTPSIGTNRRRQCVVVDSICCSSSTSSGCGSSRSSRRVVRSNVATWQHNLAFLGSSHIFTVTFISLETCIAQTGHSRFATLLFGNPGCEDPTGGDRQAC